MSDQPSAGAPADGDGPQARGQDPEARLARAREIAWRSLNRRERTVAELHAQLTGKDVEPEVADAVTAELLEGGYLDDAGFALRFAEDRRRLDGWGSERIEQRLRRLGVAAHHIAAALAERDAGAEIDAAAELLRRRFPTALETERDRSRAFGVLVRRGYDSEVAYEALRRHRDA